MTDLDAQRRNQWLADRGPARDTNVREVLNLSNMPEWHDRAACKGMSNDLFFPGSGEVNTARAAKQVCKPCPVREVCLEWAIETRQPYGVFGGRTLAERTRKRAKMKAGLL